MTKTIKNRLGYVLTLVVTFLLVSCQDDILDQVPKDALSEVTVWEDPLATELFVNAIYGSMPSGFDRIARGDAIGAHLWDSMSDDADCSIPWLPANTFDRGLMSIGGYNPFPLEWFVNYGLIRKTNLFFENIDRLPEGNDEIKNRLIGEVSFLRAFINFQLLKQYGLKPKASEDPLIKTGIIIVDRVLNPDDNWQLERNTYAECMDFIEADLDRAIDMLPTKANTLAGRATRGAALAFKGRVMLYAASPYRDGGTSFDVDYLQKSLDASKAVIEEGEYTLFGDYRTLFLTENKNNSEIIFAKKFNGPEKIHFRMNNGWDEINSPRVFKGAGDAGWNGNCPTQEFVDSYEMTDGLSQADSGLFDPTDPYANLDPRFDATVVHHGSTFRGRVIEIQTGGSGDAGPGENSTTGYWTRKYHEEQYAVYTHSSDLDWIHIRYAEVLLNYAEAVNELNGPTSEVYDAINQIRSRASVNMPDLPGGLSKDQMRQKIRNERRIELAFEDHRFWDIQRWGIVTDLLDKKPIHGVSVSGTTGNFTFTRTEVETRNWPEKYYVHPVPIQETERNPNLKQVGGW